MAGSKRAKRWSGSTAKTLCAIAGTANPEVAARLIARRLHGIVGNVRPPYKLDYLKQLAEVVGVDGIEFARLAEEGELRHVGGMSVIRVGRGSSPMRRRFTVCHEIAHAAINKFAKDAGMRVGYFGGEVEQLCDLMASELLMPSWKVEEVCSECGPSVAAVERLANECEVSLMASGLRLLEAADWCKGLALYYSDDPGNQRRLDTDWVLGKLRWSRFHSEICGMVMDVIEHGGRRVGYAGIFEGNTTRMRIVEAVGLESPMHVLVMTRAIESNFAIVQYDDELAEVRR